MMEVKIKGIYKHFKGDNYILEDIATHTETDEEYVVYTFSCMVFLSLLSFSILLISICAMFLFPFINYSYLFCNPSYNRNSNAISALLISAFH